jgi:hypothetical protein
MASEQPSPEPPHPQCPWCDYTDAVLKKVLNHMESAHPWPRFDLALSPLIAGHGLM